MGEQRLNKNLILGQDEKSDILEGKGEPIIAGNCIWCDKPVWASSLCYTVDNPRTDSIMPLPKDARILHKLCLIEIIATGKDVVFAVDEMLYSKNLN